MRKIILLISLIAFFSSCRKDIQNTFILYTNLGINDTVWTNRPINPHVADSLSNAINNTKLFVDSFDITKGRIIKLSDSLEVSIQPYSCFDPDNNTPTTGNVRIEVLALRKKGDYIKYLLPTTSNKYLLESGGTFYVRLSQNNHELALKPNGYLKLKWVYATPKINMKFFELVALRSQDSLYTWMPGYGGNIAVWDSTSFGVAKRGYEMTSNLIGWLNCSLFIDTLQQGTRLNVTLPPNYTNKNTFVFATFKDSRTIVRLNADFNSRSFYALNVPLNSSITLLSISLIDNHYYWASKDATVVNANRFSLSPGQPGINAIINNLDNLQ
jgi:hypothetical protein